MPGPGTPDSGHRRRLLPELFEQRRRTSRLALVTPAALNRAAKADLRRAEKGKAAADAGCESVASVATRYSSVAHTLKAEIASGEYDLGSKLATEFELCHRFDVSRSTVRQALAELESAGLVKRRQGSGTTVVAREPAVRYSLSIASESDILRFASETVLELTEFAAPVSSADSRRLRLGAPSEWRVWRGLRQATASGLPLGIATVYIPAIYTDTMRRLEKRPQRAIFDYIASSQGLVLTAIEQEISATVIDTAESDVLQTPVGTPALSILRRFVCEQRLIEVAETIYPSDRFSYEIRLERDNSGKLPR
jgi:GntR family transcriptional regulator